MHSSKPSKLHFTERVNKMDVESFVDNEKQDKRSQKAEERSATKIHIHPSKPPEFEKNN